MDQPLRARVALVNGHAELALIERHVRGRHYWTLPGGRIEAGETPEEAAVREVREELGLEVRLTGTLGVAGDQVVFWAATPGRPDLVLGGPEAARSNPENRYTPAWVPVTGLDGLRIRSPKVRALLAGELLPLPAPGLLAAAGHPHPVSV